MLQLLSGYIKTTSSQVLKQQESGGPPPPLECWKYYQNAQFGKSSLLSIVSLDSKERVHILSLCIWEVSAVLLMAP